MKNIKKIKDDKKSATSKDSWVRENLRKSSAKDIIKCPEMGV